MGFDEEFLRELFITFVSEAREHLDAVTSRLLALEKGMDNLQAFQHWANVFREMHSLKGAARAMNVERVEILAHRLETLFGRVREDQLSPTPAFYDLAYQTLDAISDLVNEVGGQTPASTLDVAELVARLDAASTAREVAPAPAKLAPDAPPGPSTATETLSQPESVLLVPAVTSTPPQIADADASVAPVRAVATAGASKLPDSMAAPPVSYAPSPPKIAPAPATREIKTGSPAAEVAAAHPPAASAGTVSVDETVRVTTAKLEALMAQVGELQVARLGGEQRAVELRTLLEDLELWQAEGRSVYGDFRFQVRHDARRAVSADLAHLTEIGNRLRELQRRYEMDQRRLTQVMTGLQDDVRRMRMLPINTVFQTFPRMVRDLARAIGKDVRLVIEGGDTEVDRSVLEQIKDPLTHLLRNAVDHGIELPQARATADKPVEGVIRLAASQRGDSILIEVSDDGAGIDVARVRSSAVKKGLVTAAEAAEMNDREALWLIFRSGVSTSTTITDLSGRGVGMDVVRDKVERLHGVMDVESISGQGSRFILTLPLTVATTLCLLLQVGKQVLAVPIINVTRIVRLTPEVIGYAEGQAVLRTDGRPILLLNLAEILGIADAKPQTTNRKAPQVVNDLGTAVILGSAEKRLAFRVDTVLSAQEVVVKSLPRPFVRVRHLVGASILGTGEVVLVLNAADLLRAPAQTASRPTSVESITEDAPRALTLLVADDSITTRTLEKNILEAAGYRVRAVADGLEAWQALQDEGCMPDGLYSLLVSDVAMPRLTGFDLTARVRGDARLKSLPIVLVTSLDSREDRERGVQAGADAYIVKGAFDQDNLLDTIRRLI